MFSENTLNQILEGITQNYQENSLFHSGSGHKMPNRDSIIHIILGLRQIMFPGYFDDECLNRTLPTYFLGHNLIKLYDSLSTQVSAALIQQQNSRSQEASGEEQYLETDKKEIHELKDYADEICTTFFSALPRIQTLLLKDVQAAYNGDPAARSKEEIIFCYPGFFAVFVYRMAHELYLLKVPFIPRIMSEYAHDHSGVDINPGASIGEYFFIDHGTGVVIGETTTIGSNVKIYQGVTLGALSTRSGQLLRDVKRHPTIEDNVTIYSNASILGGETVIGAGSVIGGNSFITESVPKGSRVSIKAPELSITEKKPTGDLFD